LIGDQGKSVPLETALIRWK